MFKQRLRALSLPLALQPLLRLLPLVLIVLGSIVPIAAQPIVLPVDPVVRSQPPFDPTPESSGLTTSQEPLPTPDPDSGLSRVLPRDPFVDCASVVGMDPADCSALEALFNATGGVNWTNPAGWLTTDTPCTWHGVNCTGNRVSVLALGANNLVGAIPAALGNLTNLQVLSLDANVLTGTIPAALGNLVNLEFLNLDSSQLTGVIPVEFGNLTSLKELYLGGNNLSGTIPPELGNLVNLTHLQMHGNALTGTIPVSLGNLTSLQNLVLYGNLLTGSIPSEFGNLTALTYLALNENKLSGNIPVSLGNLTALQVLDFHDNALSGTIPSSMGSMTALQILDLRINDLSGTIPPELGNLSNLKELNLQRNFLSGSLPPELGNLSNLTQLDLHFNLLSGSIPASLGNLSNLVTINLDSNGFTGSIPASFGNLGSLERLFLGGNQLSGSIPPELGNLSNLVNFQAHGNALTGVIPASLGNLVELKAFYIYANNLTGTIPNSLANLTNLRYLALSENNLTGTIPAFNMPQLKGLYLHRNQLTGTIPASLGGSTNLEILYLDHNNLSGNLPASFANLTSLQEFWVSKNELTGAFPTWLGTATGLTQVFMEDNHFTGTIPADLGTLTNLVYLDLHDNQLSGAIPASLGSLANLQHLGLSLNQLKGDIPVELANLSPTIELFIDYNILTTTDPTLIAFLESVNPDWDDTQTVIPKDIAASFDSASFTLTISWSPILYTWHKGYYEVECTDDALTFNTQTDDKAAFSAQFVSLPIGSYDCQVRTVTKPNSKNQNLLITDFSDPVIGSVTTQSPPPNDDFDDPEIIDSEPSLFYQASVNLATPDNNSPVPPETCVASFNAATAKSIHYEILPEPEAIRGGPGHFGRGSTFAAAGGPGHFAGGRADEIADTVLAVYQVNENDTLTLIDCNDDAPNIVNGGSLVIFDRDETQTYRIIVWTKVTAPLVLVETSQSFLLNAGFDLDNNNDKRPDGWKANTTDGLKFKCKPELAVSPPCALQFKGTGLKIKVSHKLSRLEAFDVGHAVSLTAYLNGKNIQPGSTIALKFTYEDVNLGDGGKVKLIYDIPSGTSDGYQQIESDELILEGKIAKATVQISFQNIGGRLRVDDIDINNSTPASGASPDQSAPPSDGDASEDDPK